MWNRPGQRAPAPFPRNMPFPYAPRIPPQPPYPQPPFHGRPWPPAPRGLPPMPPSIQIIPNPPPPPIHFTGAWRPEESWIERNNLSAPSPPWHRFPQPQSSDVRNRGFAGPISIQLPETRKRPAPVPANDLHELLIKKRQTMSLTSFATTPSILLEIEIRVEISARTCRIYWELPKAHERAWLGGKQMLKVREEHTTENNSLVDKTLPMSQCFCQVETTPGGRYVAKLVVHGKDGKVVGFGQCRFKAVFSLAELENLLLRANNFLGEGMEPFTYMFRCKPKFYWDQIYAFDQIVHKYIKDENGHAASPINGEIHGLFFTAKTVKNSSPFGDVRMAIPAWKLLHPGRVNLYFADFYCNSKVHYVTLVVALKGSPTDRFCCPRLKLLDPVNNLFLRMVPIHQGGGLAEDHRTAYQVNAHRASWVEIYWTEDLPMHMGQFHNIVAIGAGTAKIGGLSHNKQCQVCNLHPTPPSLPSTSTASTNLSNLNETLVVVPSGGDEELDLLDNLLDICDDEIGDDGDQAEPNVDYLFPVNTTQVLLHQLMAHQGIQEHISSGFEQETFEVADVILGMVDSTVHEETMEKLKSHKVHFTPSTTKGGAIPESFESMSETRKILERFSTYSQNGNLLVANLVGKLRAVLDRMESEFATIRGQVALGVPHNHNVSLKKGPNS